MTPQYPKKDSQYQDSTRITAICLIIMLITLLYQIIFG